MNSPANKKIHPLTDIYFYLTDSCNLRCRHCWVEPRPTDKNRDAAALEPALFEAVIVQAKALGLKGVKLTGGEPLLHPEIERLLQIVRREELALTVETNGVLCTAQTARLIAACPAAFVAVSLDAADPEIHDWIRGGKGSFAAAVEGIRNLTAAGLRPQLIMTVMERNKGQVEPLIRLAESLGAGSVKFNVLQPTARGERMHEKGGAVPVGELIALGRRVDGELSEKAGIPLYFHQPPAFRPLGRMFGPAGDGCHACGILGILGVLADGSYALCGIGVTVPELVFGQAAVHPLKEVWEGSAVLREIREGLPQALQGICGRCALKGLCLGSCLAQNYYRSRDLWAPHWYCEEARAAGLFPETRLTAPRLEAPL